MDEINPGRCRSLPPARRGSGRFEEGARGLWGVDRDQDGRPRPTARRYRHSRREHRTFVKGVTMRFGTRRGVAPLLAFALTAVIATGVVATASVQAVLICHTIPREVAAVDVKTGGPYFAPPIPYGCYAKDCLGTIAEACGLVKGGLSGLLHGCCPGCGGGGCDQCGGTGKCGHCGLCTGPGMCSNGG